MGLFAWALICYDGAWFLIAGSTYDADLPDLGAWPSGLIMLSIIDISYLGVLDLS
jgi:hypothetical protein